MTELRPEHDAGREASYEQGAYEAAGAFEAAVEQLADPLNDPLPGQDRPAAAPGPGPGPDAGVTSPWFRPATAPPAAQPVNSGYEQQYEPYRQPVRPMESARPAQEAAQEAAHEAVREPQQPLQQPQGSYGSQGRPQGWYGGQQPAAAPEPMPVPPATSAPPASTPAPAPPPPPAPVFDDETVALRTDDTRRMAEAGAVPVTGGRAERRRAAKGKRGRGRAPEAKGGGKAEASPEPPRSRLEARRAARAAKDSPAVVASRFFGEMFISLGVLMLLFVTYQLWWTNVRAGLFAGKETDKIQEDWANGRKPGAFEPGQGFAIMHIPKLDVVVPIAEGIDKARVLDNGMVGHYAEGKLKTAMPSDKQGNFAVAGHRNTHGEPFRYINQLQPGDPIVVETQDTYYTYEMASILPQTSPSNVSVIGPVPPGSGFTRPGRYITLTTCTPEFTSTYRMIVWGKMVDERPRSKGQPDALVG
ncbi:class E sortase [Streptomyces flavidovirens]|uniref:class E sortase n=1 Tax=Streptomyces flavidovirens TaxID=67298 RepID=UPI0004114B3E|nr:class E sortase [Streptomyces flavidovirens]